MEEELTLDSPHSNSQMLLENSDWLAENVNGLDQSVEDMANLIERCSLQTPEKKIQMQENEVRVVDSDLLCPNSGNGISDTTPNSGSESSFLSSDTDSESYYQTPYGHSISRLHAKKVKHETADLASEVSGVDNAMTKQCESKRVGECGEYELEESNVLNLKLQMAEEEIIKLRNQLRDNEAALIKMGNLETELESARDKIKLHEEETENESTKSLALRGQIVDLETELEAEKKQVRGLKDVIAKHDSEIQKLKSELQDNTGSFALEKWQLESRISRLQEDLSSHETKAKEFEAEIELLYEKNKAHEAEKAEMERNHRALGKKWEAETRKKDELFDNVSDELDGLNLKCKQLLEERDEIKTSVRCLVVEIGAYEEQVRTLEENLRSENKQLIGECEGAKKLISELNSRIEELEKEVGIQCHVISERGEEKREAIRQLCFSIDHYKSVYGELRGAYLMHRRRTSPS